jgi:hypothetical protein
MPDGQRPTKQEPGTASAAQAGTAAGQSTEYARLRAERPGGPVDVSKPNVARVYDYLLGGFEAFAADREQAAGLLRISPSLGLAALENRYFLARAITWAAGQGLTQFADLGAGAPIRKPSAGVMEDTHVTARAVSSSARVAYVDNDRVVLSRSMAFRAAGKGVAVIDADLTDTSSVLADPALRAVIDAEQPVCLIFGLVLSLLAARRAHEVVAAYAERIAAGSLIVISTGRCDDETLWKQLSETYTAADLHNHSQAEVDGFLAGLEVIPPGLTPAQNWRGGWHDAPATPPGPAYVLGAVARKPLLLHRSLRRRQQPAAP